MTGLSAPCEFAACRISLLQRMAGSTGRVAAWRSYDKCPVWAEAVWKRICLLFSMSNQEMSDEAFH